MTSTTSNLAVADDQPAGPDVVEQVTLLTHPLRPRLLTVAAVERIAARMVRVRLTGEDLADFVTVAPEDHVKLFLPTEPGGTPEMPEVVDDRWVGGRHLTSRDYTVRFFDREARTLDIDLVLHEHGIAGRWAGRAQVGDLVGVLGPRGSFLVNDVFDWYVFAVDETALPAAARWLERLRADVPVTVFVEVQDEGDVLPLASAASLDVTWLFREDRAPGTTALLADAVRGTDLPAGNGFVWVAGEALSIKPLRRYLKNEVGLGRDNFDVDGYWRKGVADHDHHDDDTEAAEDPAGPDAALPTGSTADAGSSAPASGPSGD
ncbi:siderophore-interacting protein [Oerskovia enterophila]|uniref:Vibriobactin utilization protein ViuB n=1 Tax=Oerskovia enterophila TaxID=43678 RepID=A0A163T3A2_9CELL|nr:siderophore-interacting protein [Oerskovia enterophila]KZM37054.1 vibriobactin utilization protein ViuB [Oerskovia enterophila]OCI29831.1 vibriobactin utilization protein ViuB [Oerskovia enterophila]